MNEWVSFVAVVVATVVTMNIHTIVNNVRGDGGTQGQEAEDRDQLVDAEAREH